MTQNVGSSPVEGAATLNSKVVIRATVAIVILVALLAGAFLLHGAPGYGAPAAFSLLVGVALGLLFERGRFCFFCIYRDLIEEKNSGPFYAILSALAVGATGYAIVFGIFLPNAASGRFPPEAHIGPVSWVLVVAGLAFGLGMALSGACISGHLYRLGEGYSRAPIALFGTLLGFGVGFYSWNSLYLAAIAGAPVVWLPAWLGYGGALALHLAILAGLALWLLPRVSEQAPQAAHRITPGWVWNRLFGQRWHPLVTGAGVGLVGVFAYLRVEPLGVTAQLGSISRTTLFGMGLLPERLNGLDSFAGCATIIAQAITDNGWLISGLVLASFAAALLSNRFSISQLTLGNSVTALLGGMLMGWGAMSALGCTVGTLLSGISAFALSGWLFAIAVFGGVWLGIRLRLHTF